MAGPIAPSVVEVAPAGGGYEIDNVLVDGGLGAVNRQVIALGDPADGSARATVRNAAPAPDDYGLVVRIVEAGAAPGVPFDSGLVGLTATAQLVTPAANCAVATLLLANLTDQVQPIECTDAGGGSYGGQPLEPHELRVVPFGGLTVAGGLLLRAPNGAGCVNAQSRGTQ
jgi:hypothetical protein